MARSCCRFPSAARAREQSSTTRRARRLGHRDAQPHDSPCRVGFCYVLCTPANRTANSPTQERHAFKHAKSTDLAKAKGETGGATGSPPKTRQAKTEPSAATDTQAKQQRRTQRLRRTNKEHRRTQTHGHKCKQKRNSCKHKHKFRRGPALRHVYSYDSFFGAEH